MHSFLSSLIALIKPLALQTTIGLPEAAWWLPALVLFILAAAALSDAISMTVPDGLILLGLLAVGAVQALYVGGTYAWHHLRDALIVAVSLWCVNELWYRITKRDALGMGDAKWSALAVACFGLYPVILAWGVGAWLALTALGIKKMQQRPAYRICFAPFLFAGLIVSLWWYRFRG